MFRSPQVRSLRNNISPRLRILIVAISLFACAPMLRAQQLSGLQSPVEKEPSAKQEMPIEVRAARGRAPLSRLYDYLKVEPAKVRKLPALTQQEMQAETESKRLRIGTVRTFAQPLRVSTDAVRYNIAEGDVSVIGVASEGALYTRVHFKMMSLPAGARVFVYSAKNPDDFYGPYEGHGPSDDGTFWTPPVEGDEAIIEYFTPRGITSADDAPFQISEINHIYRSLFTDTNDTAGACNLEVSSAWTGVAKSVGYLEFTSGGSEFACTGTLLNNASNDQTPYLLTANHCFDQQVEAQTLRVYWFYNSGDSPPAGTPHTDGANLLSTSTSSDFSFVRLTGALPGGLYFSGWDATATPLSTAVTGIHHPEGSHKRISFGNTISGCGAGLPGPCQNFTNIHWNSGTTEPGSSGSGIWTGSSSDPKLVGTLTGGFASCSNLSGTDYYGSFSITYQFIASFLQQGDNGADDSFEDNDTRANARALESGSYSNLVVKGIDEDWYKVSVIAGGAVAFKVDFTNSKGNIDIQLFRGSETSPTETSQGVSDSERVISINQTGATVDYYLRVFAPPGTQNTYTLTIGGAGAVCTPVPINFGQTVSGSLSTSDCLSAFRIPNFSGNYYSDHYSFTAQQGQQIGITLTPVTSFNTYLIVQGVTGQMVYTDLPTGGKAGSVASFTAPSTGTYTIEASSYDPAVTGNYTVTLAGQPDTVSISQEFFTVGEGDGRIAITVNRGPNASGAASVDYFTGESLPSFDPCSKTNSSASPRCDYANTMGTLNFAPGEKSKTVYVPIVDDSYAEGRETFLFYLNNPVGVNAGQILRAFIDIIDNDSVPGPNPITQTQFFIRQQYIDFLGREPDPVGWQGWQDILNNCKAGDTSCDRIAVSSGFFRSPEFQDRGYFIYRFYATLGRPPNYGEFMPDLAKVSGFLSDQQLEANKAAFVNQFTSRGEFQGKYLFLTDSAYVDALLQTLGLPNHPLKATWVAGLTNKTLTRAQVLRALIESAEVYQKYYNEAFVVMQYFGYLRRDPDILYLDWIKTMNSNGGDYRTMINGFMNSTEYVLRFGP